MKQGSWLALVFALVSPAAQAFTLIAYNDLHGISGDKVTVSVNPSNCGLSTDAMNSLIDSAIQLWNGVYTSRLILERGPDVSTTPAQAQAGSFSEQLVVVCDPAFSTTTGASANSIIGLGGPKYVSVPAHEILRSTVIINAEVGGAANIANIPTVAAQIAFAHEFGHALGLGHSGSAAALMYYSVGNKEQLALSIDDMDGITFLYPRQELGGSGALGCATVQGVDPGGPGSGNRAFEALLWLAVALGTVRGLRGVRWRLRWTSGKPKLSVLSGLEAHPTHNFGAQSKFWF